jgi:hypothetical protein
VTASSRSDHTWQEEDEEEEDPAAGLTSRQAVAKRRRRKGVALDIFLFLELLLLLLLPTKMAATATQPVFLQDGIVPAVPPVAANRYQTRPGEVTTLSTP